MVHSSDPFLVMNSEQYSLLVSKAQTQVKISVKAFDAAHAQGQALDIARSLEADRFELGYGIAKQNKLSELFEKLAYNDFDHKECYEWQGSLVNKVPAVYTLNKRFYVRPLILGYLDISKDAVVKNVCKNPLCVNPYHNQYLHEKNSKIGGGDLQMLLAFRSQGASVPQIAKALNVHRSTIYRTFKNECLLTGGEDCR